MTQPRTPEQQAARDHEVSASVARDLLHILDRTSQGYRRALTHLTDEQGAAHLRVVDALDAFVALALVRYGVHPDTQVRGYVTGCDEPGCFAESSMVRTLDLEVVHAAARAEGWHVVVLDSGRSVARCPKHLPGGGA